MRRATLITGVILLLLGGAFTGWHLSGQVSPVTFHTSAGDFHDDSFLSALGPWALHVSWSAEVNNSSGSNPGPYVLYVTLVRPTSCVNVSGVIASQIGTAGSLVVDVHGATRWYIFVCNSLDSRIAFDGTHYGLGFSYYLATGIALTALGAGVTALSFYQKPVPPLLGRTPRSIRPPGPPPPP